MSEDRYRKLAVCKSLVTVIICLFLAELLVNYIFNWLVILFAPVRFVYYAMPAVCAVLLVIALVFLICGILVRTDYPSPRSAVVLFAIAAALVLYMLICFFVHLADIRTALSENAIYIFL